MPNLCCQLFIVAPTYRQIFFEVLHLVFKYYIRHLQLVEITEQTLHLISKGVEWNEKLL